MYKRILVPVENSDYDATIIEYITRLAKLCGSTVVIIHVADGWVARNIRQLDLRESEEMKEDLAYIERVATSLQQQGITAEAVLASGDPGAEISAAADREKCDLIAMATHGHKLLNDLLRGSVANAVRHSSTVPVLMVRGMPRGPSPAQ
ncbi:MAG: universal stress protein [Gemmatimonadaceae bacterium]